MNDRVSSKVRRRRRCSARPAPPVPMAAQVITVAGYASLMDEASARSTTPSLSNWRCAAPRPTCAPQDPCLDLNRRRVVAGTGGWTGGSESSTWSRSSTCGAASGATVGSAPARPGRPRPARQAGSDAVCTTCRRRSIRPCWPASAGWSSSWSSATMTPAVPPPSPSTHTHPYTHPSPCHSLPPPSTLPSRRCAATGSARLFVGWSDEVCPHMGPCWHTAAVLLLVAPLLIAPLLHVPHAALPSLLLQVPPNYGCASGLLCL